MLSSWQASLGLSSLSTKLVDNKYKKISVNVRKDSAPFDNSVNMK